MQREWRKCWPLSKLNISGNLSQGATLVMYYNFDKLNLIDTCWNSNWVSKRSQKDESYDINVLSRLL